ncbi:ABC transporter ATP-binding protein [Sediminibacillus halophilus]|uniref:Iron complex transport system ATP-binding protein n=1 Tax=Sediminibacillus halophilus TaxID=482461 RepID=A0A1G9X7U2_9BACI|nr:ABC transporter ATP-binding protein [Sediminibacillus halophilus]SDM92798.1 iron complex transport system ATP-binding protein [Sediminibacillus halophilus]
MQKEIIETKQVTFQRDGRNILQKVDWRVSPGEHWVILGLNGSGKTSLLKIVTGYEWPTKGTVDVLGNRFGRTNLPELRKSIGWVSASLDEQFLKRASDTALEVVLSGKHASIGIYEAVNDQEVFRAEKLLEEMKMADFADRPFVKLSQGEKRRVIIARALMPDPEILILDEPCNGLDVFAKEQLLTTIQRMAVQKGGPTLLYVTHQLEEVIPAITHALLINHGKIVAAGEKEKTLTDSLMTETFQVPVEIEWRASRPWLKIKSTL